MRRGCGATEGSGNRDPLLTDPGGSVLCDVPRAAPRQKLQIAVTNADSCLLARAKTRSALLKRNAPKPTTPLQLNIKLQENLPG